MLQLEKFKQGGVIGSVFVAIGVFVLALSETIEFASGEILNTAVLVAVPLGAMMIASGRSNAVPETKPAVMPQSGGNPQIDTNRLWNEYQRTYYLLRRAKEQAIAAERDLQQSESARQQCKRESEKIQVRVEMYRKFFDKIGVQYVPEI